MANVDVVCPSGFAGMVRGWKTKEANILGSRKSARSYTTFDKIISACWLETTDPGPYKFQNGVVDWGKVLLCDRFWVLLRQRAATYGDGYEFDTQCQDRGLCGKKIEWECNLSELPFKELPEESRAKIAAGDNSFECELMHGEMAGRKVMFHLQTGHHEVRGAKMLEGQDTRIVVAALASRIDSIESVQKGDLIRTLDDLEMGDLMNLMNQFDEADGGVETTIEIECPHCGLLQDVELPLGRAFFLPRFKRRRRATSPLDSL